MTPLTKLTLRVLAATALSSVLGSAAIAEDINQRVDRIEQKLNALIDLLERQQAPQSPAASSAEPAESEYDGGASSNETASSFRPGVLNLDLYANTLARDQQRKMNFDASEMPDGPLNAPAGSAVVNVSTSFAYDAFIKIQNLSRFKNADALVSIAWTGQVSIPDSGDYVFQSELSKDRGYGVGSCKTVLRLNGQKITQAKFDASDGQSTSNVEQGKISLAKGLYDFSVWLSCVRYSSNDNLDQTSVFVSVVEPGARAPKPIPAEWLGISE